MTSLWSGLGAGEARAQFEAEPTEYRWIFYREVSDVWVRLLELRDSADHDNVGTEIWSSWQTADTVARAVIRCFDDVVGRYGESGYRGQVERALPSFTARGAQDGLAGQP